MAWVVHLLDAWFPRSVYAIGGGTVLAARWQHRLSTDIDLFLDERIFQDTVNSSVWAEISMKLNQESLDGTILDLRVRPTGFSFRTHHGPVSFYSSPRMTPDAISQEQESTTGLYAESTTEILFKKLRGRMVNATRYVARDLYDIIVCYMLEKQSLHDAMQGLEELELESLRYDVQTGDAVVRDVDRVIQPRYAELTSDFDEFNRIAGEILSRNVSNSTEQVLQRLLDKH